MNLKALASTSQSIHFEPLFYYKDKVPICFNFAFVIRIRKCSYLATTQTINNVFYSFSYSIFLFQYYLYFNAQCSFHSSYIDTMQGFALLNQLRCHSVLPFAERIKMHNSKCKQNGTLSRSITG